MPSLSPRSVRRELILAKLESLLDECDFVADNAPLSETFDILEDFFFDRGRKFLRETFKRKFKNASKKPKDGDIVAGLFA